MTDPKSCMKLQMGHATSLCLWKASGMTGCSIPTPISFLSLLPKNLLSKHSEIDVVARLHIR